MPTVSEQKFFSVPIGTSSVVNRIAKKIEDQNRNARFVTKLCKMEGYPIWNKSMIYAPQSADLAKLARENAQGSSDTIVIIPLVLENGKQVNSFLACRAGEDSIEIKLFKGRRYPFYGFSPNIEKLSAEAIASQLMHLDHAVFGDTLFRITDKRLFNFRNDTANRYVKIKPKRSYDAISQGTTGYISVTSCETVMYDGDQGQLVGVEPGGSNDYYYSYEVCSTQYYYFTDSDTYNGGGSGGGESTGDGGGGGGSYDSGSGGSIGGSTGGSTGSTGSGTGSTSGWYDSDPCPGYSTEEPSLQEPSDTFDDLTQDPCGGTLGWEPTSVVGSQLNSIAGPEDSYYFDNSIDPNSPSFNNVSEFQNYLNQFTSEVSVSNDGTNEPIVNFRINRTFVGGVDLFVKLEKNSSNVFSVKEVTSSEWGVTLGWSWEQKSYSTSSNDNMIIIDVYGYEKYNIFIEGVGTVYYAKRHYQVKIDKNTGKPISIISL